MASRPERAAGFFFLIPKRLTPKKHVSILVKTDASIDIDGLAGHGAGMLRAQE